ncbi:MAG: hypothetical protein V3V84_00610 [Candidatus Bathyarchaeia archaeon]
MNIKPTEYQLHVSFHQWCRYNWTIGKYIFAIEHGELRNPAVGAKLKKKGVRSGMADFMLILPNNFYNNLWIEFKVGKNVQTESQKIFQQLVDETKGKYVICRDLESAIEAVEGYVSNGILTR